jgi:predicted nuclease with TOPRIM domain
MNTIENKIRTQLKSTLVTNLMSYEQPDNMIDFNLLVDRIFNDLDIMNIVSEEKVKKMTSWEGISYPHENTKKKESSDLEEKVKKLKKKVKDLEDRIEKLETFTHNRMSQGR